jgi:putative peptide zinc metalloprotease protein
MQLNPIELIPILSKDIEITNLSKADFVLSNEKHKHYIKISKEVKDLISIIDNKKNIIEITDFYNINFNSSISSDFVFNLIYKKLSKYGLLENYGEIKKTNKPNYLKLSIIIINERTVEKIVKCFYFLFKPRIALCFLIFSFIFFAYTINTFLDQYHEFNIQKSIISLFIITLFSGILHEIGHATSTSLFGSKHGGIGIGFYLFSPVLFADVTDIWRLSKTKRIIVNLSGIYFEILFCTTILLLNILLKNNLLGILTTFVFIKTFTNLNRIHPSNYILFSSIRLMIGA